MKKWIIGGVLLVLFSAIVGAGYSDGLSNAENDYRRTLESGQKKYYSGQKMTKEEYNAVKSFNDWKSKQGTKKYSDWD